MNIAANPAPGFQRNPSRRITVEPFEGAVTVVFSDAILASSDNALVLREADYPPVFYIPFKDIYFEFLKRSDTSTHCPYKGDAILERQRGWRSCQRRDVGLRKSL